MIRKIAVWEHTTGKRLPVGEMVAEVDDLGRARCQFRYLDDFLARGDAYPLDPVSLPLDGGTFAVDRKVVFDVLEDSLPDDWGRKLLVRRYRLQRGEQNLASLLEVLGADGLGALSFTSDGKDKTLRNPGSGTEASIIELDQLLDAAERYERGDAGDPLFSLLLTAGSSPGGARPKVLVYDRQADEHYLAKFPSVKDTVDVVRVEAGSMSLAVSAGLNPASSRLISCAGRPVLLVRRFDIIPFGRRHMVSFRTLLRADGYYIGRYGELHSAVRKYSADPARDAELLFRQMVFNALIGNTDDHLKNFWMVYGQGDGWRLSPAFDLVPNIAEREEHVLFFDLDPIHPGREALVQIGRSWGISGSQKIVDAVYEAVAGWKGCFAESGVTAQDIARFKEIDANLLKR